MRIIVHWLVSAAAIIVSAFLLGGVHVDGFVTALVLALVLGLINGILRPVLVVLTLPVTVMTFGLFLFVINTLLVMLAAMIVPGFSIDGFWSALAFSIVLSLVNVILHGLFESKVK